jgi:site-specific DNA-methyltransferase (adenine-specific)
MNFQKVDANDIQVKDRQREKFDEKSLSDLADSISRVGLIHAPAVTEANTLVAGERRLRALRILGERSGSFRYAGVDFKYPQIPVHVLPYKDPKLLYEIELEENLRRENLTPMEQAKAIAKLHKVRSQQVPTQTVKDTAQEVASLAGKTPTANDEVVVAESLLVDEFADDPEVQAAAKTSLRKAAKIARKKMELQFLSALNTQQTSDFFRVFGGDAGMVMEAFEERVYDILLFDPPYGVDANKFGEQAHALGHQYEDTFDTACLFLDKIMANLRIFKENFHVLMFCSPDLFNDWKMYYENHGFRVWPRPLIWSKGTGHLPVPDRGPRYTYENILFAVRGNRTVAKVTNDVFSVSPPRDKIHAAEKPVELLRQLLEFVSKPGDRILDPCCGSGPIFTAARDMEVFVDGIEIDDKYVHVAKERANEK